MVSPAEAAARAQDGCRLVYRLYPQPEKPRLALVHSLGLDAGIWDEVIAEAGRDFEILAYDCRGHGRSDRRPGPYTAHLFGGDLAAVFDHCQWPSAIVAGCSMGGCVAQAFAATYPQRVLALALIDTTAWYGLDARENWRKRAEKAAADGFPAMLPFQLSRWFGDAFRTAHPARLEAVSRVFLANDITCYQASCTLLGSEDLRGVLGSIRVPVAVIVGEEDFATPVAMAEALHAAISRSTLTVIPGGRHLTPIECSREIVARFGDLARRIPVPQAT